MTASKSFITDFYGLAKEKGLDADDLLRNAGIDKALIDSSNSRAPSEKLASVVVNIWDQLGDEAMGLSGSPIPSGAFHMMGKLAVGELTLRKALAAGIKFYV